MGKEKVHTIIVVLGHVGSGKSTVAHHINKPPNKSSFKSASMPEQLKADSERGTTIDIAKWKFETPKYCTVFDAPGNHNFIKNMITGTSQADCAILVIDSTIRGFETGISEDGPTILQHALFARTLAVKQIICCCNKMDATNPKYSNRFDKIVENLTHPLMMVGCNRDMVRFVPISGVEGNNVIEKFTSLDWYDGPTLFEAIDHIQEPKKPSHKPLRLPLLNVYESDHGTVGVGCVETGTLKDGMRVTFGPSGCATKVKSLEVNGEAVLMALPGEIVSFPVENLLAKGLRRGHVASNSKKDPAKEAKSFKAKVNIMNNYEGQIGNGYNAILDCHTSHDAVVFTEILAKIDPGSGEVLEKNPEFLKCGEAGLVKMVPLNPMVAEAFSEYPQLGCIVISDTKQTVAFGVIESVEKKDTRGVIKFIVWKAGRLVADVLGRALIMAACQLLLNELCGIVV